MSEFHPPAKPPVGDSPKERLQAEVDGSSLPAAAKEEQKRSAMDFADASLALAQLIRGDHFDYDEEAGLAIQVFSDAIEDGETPAMALALAKNSNQQTTG